MKTLDELQHYYNQQLLPDLKELEKKRKKIVLESILLTFLCFFQLGFVLVLIYILFKIDSPCATCCIPILPFTPLFAWLIVYNLIKRNYVKDFKTNVMAKIVRFIDENLTYMEGNSISRENFVRSKLFLTNPDRFGGEDYVSGTVGKTKIEFSEMHAEERHEYTDSKGHHHTSYTTIFRGIFFIADFNKNFKGLTVVIPDTAERLLGSFIGSKLQSMNIRRPKVVKLEDPEFEKFFAVYGDDQIEARYILSTSLMQRISEFRKKTNKNIYLSFVEDKIMIAIPYARDLFEPRVWRTMLDYKQVEDYFKNLELAIGIVEELNLNTRIWGKK